MAPQPQCASGLRLFRSPRRSRRRSLSVLLTIWVPSSALHLTLKPSPISTLWPPNSIVLAALLLTPTRWWGLILLGALPAHLAVQLPLGFPPALILGWYISNCSEALVGAVIVRHLVKGPLRFDRSHGVGVFILGAAFVGTLVSCFLDAGFVTLGDDSDGQLSGSCGARVCSPMSSTSLVLVPVIVSWCRGRGLPIPELVRLNRAPAAACAPHCRSPAGVSPALQR